MYLWCLSCNFSFNFTFYKKYKANSNFLKHLPIWLIYKQNISRTFCSISKKKNKKKHFSSNLLCLTGLIKMHVSVLGERQSFKMLGMTFSSKLDWGPCIISIAKTSSKKSGALIRSMKFLSPEVVLYPYKSTIRPCMEYCCHVWAGAPSC